jgi:hypothetical protein
MPNDPTRVEIITGRERRRCYTANESESGPLRDHLGRGALSLRSAAGAVKSRACSLWHLS